MYHGISEIKCLIGGAENNILPNTYTKLYPKPNQYCKTNTNMGYNTFAERTMPF